MSTSCKNISVCRKIMTYVASVINIQYDFSRLNVYLKKSLFSYLKIEFSTKSYRFPHNSRTSRKTSGVKQPSYLLFFLYLSTKIPNYNCKHQNKTLIVTVHIYLFYFNIMATRNFRARHQQDHKRRSRKNFFTSDSYSDTYLNTVNSPFPKIKIFVRENCSKLN